MRAFNIEERNINLVQGQFKYLRNLDLANLLQMIYLCKFMCDALRDLVFVLFKKTWKTPIEECYF